MSDERPDPDKLLAQLNSQANPQKRGRLRIFFGYAAGVGKTYAMLESARRMVALGKDVVIGYLEPHARPATMQLATKLERMELRSFDYRGLRIQEFDVDAALARQPEILLLDELAHSNAEGAKHKKRWQDAMDLLDAGIDVWTTLNVQHIESLNDIIGSITDVLVRETIPDQVFESADEIELVDVPPDDLLERLSKGLIYMPDQAQRAVQHFFKLPNLNALREMALRQAANRVHTEVETARSMQVRHRPWATAERLLVCVGPSPTTARVIRTCKRMATALDAKWSAVSVDLPGHAMKSQSASQIAQHFRLAERLGAETLTLAGDSVVDTIMEYARMHNVTKIFIGKTSEPKWKRWIAKSVVERLIDASGGIDVYVIQGEHENNPRGRVANTRRGFSWTGHLMACLVCTVAGLCAGSLRFMDMADAEANRIMLFLAGVAFIAFRYGVGPATTASFLSVLCFDFFFVPPHWTFAVEDAKYLVTFAVMLSIGLLIGTLASRLKVQIENSRRRERRSNSLYELGKELSSLYGEIFLVSAAMRTLGELLDSEIAVYLKNTAGEIYVVQDSSLELTQNSVSLPAAAWVMDHSQVAGVGTNTLPNAIALFVPLQGSQSCLGALAIKPAGEADRLHEPDVRRLIDSGATQLALALERDRLAIESAESRLQIESERLRSTLLSSVSHDLRTPLASIEGASSSLLESETLDSGVQRELLMTIASQSQRLNRVLENILQMSKLEAGASSPNLQWHVLEEIVGSALKQTSNDLSKHVVSVDLPDEMPLILVDDLMLEQVLINLLENASKYTPSGTVVKVTARLEQEMLKIRIRDRGPGIPAGLESKIFEKFHRAGLSADHGPGNGLGLAICRAIVKLLQGKISVSNPAGGGAEFLIELPQERQPPHVDHASFT